MTLELPQLFFVTFEIDAIYWYNKVYYVSKRKQQGRGGSCIKGLVHQLDMQVLIKGHCCCDQNAIGLVAFESPGKEKSAYLS